LVGVDLGGEACGAAYVGVWAGRDAFWLWGVCGGMVCGVGGRGGMVAEAFSGMPPDDLGFIGLPLFLGLSPPGGLRDRAVSLWGRTAREV
jgi:hypothetical protein